jgi:hypothetical protein
LLRDERFNDGLAALAFAGVDGVVLYALEETEFVEIRDNPLTGFVSIETDL